MIIGSPSSFEPYVLKSRWRCPHCELYFNKDQTVLASIRNGRVMKKVCSDDCRLTFDYEYWQNVAYEKEIEKNV